LCIGAGECFVFGGKHPVPSPMGMALLAMGASGFAPRVMGDWSGRPSGRPVRVFVESGV
jgi:hypothetical protein